MFRRTQYTLVGAGMLSLLLSQPATAQEEDVSFEPVSEITGLAGQTTVYLQDSTLEVHHGTRELRASSSDGQSFSMSYEPDSRRHFMKVSVNGLTHVASVDEIVEGRVRLTPEFEEAYRIFHASAAGSYLGIPEDPATLFDVTPGEGAGCAAAGILVGLGTAGWGGAIVSGACLAIAANWHVDW